MGTTATVGERVESTLEGIPTSVEAVGGLAALAYFLLVHATGPVGVETAVVGVAMLVAWAAPTLPARQLDIPARPFRVAILCLFGLRALVVAV